MLILEALQRSELRVATLNFSGNCLGPAGASHVCDFLQAFLALLLWESSALFETLAGSQLRSSGDLFVAQPARRGEKVRCRELLSLLSPAPGCGDGALGHAFRPPKVSIEKAWQGKALHTSVVICFHRFLFLLFEFKKFRLT